MGDPYRPPGSPLREPVVERRRSSVAAVLLGGLVVDFLGTVVLGTLLAAAWIAAALAAGGDPDSVEASLGAPSIVAASTALGALMSVLGGYVAARWARRRPVAHGAAAGSVSLLLGLPFLLIPGPAEPLWLTVGSVVLQVPLAVCGGYLAGRLGAR